MDIFMRFEQTIIQTKNQFINIDTNNLEGLYDFCCITPNNNDFLSRAEITSKITDKISDIIKRNNLLELYHELDKMIKGYLYDVYKNKNEYAKEKIELLDLIKVIANSINITTNSDVIGKWSEKDQEEIWRQITSKYVIDRREESFDFFERINENLINYAKTVSRISEIIPDAIIKNGILCNKETVELELFKIIEQQILYFGAYDFYKLLIKKCIELYDHKNNWFFINDTEIPLLYHIVMKCLTSSKMKQIDNKYKYDESLLRSALKYLIDLQCCRTNKFLGFISMKNPIEYIQDILKHDSIFKLNQYDPYAMIDMVSIVFQKFEEKIMKITKLSLFEIINISKSLIYYVKAHINNLNNECEIDAEVINKWMKRKKVSVGIEKVVIYFSIFGTKNTSVNVEYASPLNINKLNDEKVLLIHKGDTENSRYILTLPEVTIVSLYEKLYEIVEYNSSVGIEYEKAIRSLISRKGEINVYSGKYVWESKVYETDGIAIIGNAVILIECKTKTLVKKSRSGDFISLANDISKSILASLTQAFRCELSFRYNKKISLYNGENVSEKEILNGKIEPSSSLNLPPNPKFYKLSCVSLSYGIINDRIVSQNIIDALTKYEYKDKDGNNSLKGILTEIEDFIDVYNRIKNCYSDNKLFNKYKGTYFITYDTLYKLLYEQKKAEGIIEALDKFLSIQFKDGSGPQNVKSLFSI